MLARIMIYLVLGGVAWWFLTSMRRRNQTRIPEMPQRWRLLAAVDERLQEAVNMRDRLAELAARPDNAMDRGIVFDVDELMASVSEVVELRIELERHIQVLEQGQLRDDAELLLEPEVATRQKDLLATIEERPARLNHEVAAAVGDLRELYLHVLDNLQKPGLATDSAVQKARDRATELRTRMDAERELKLFLEDEKTTVH